MRLSSFMRFTTASNRLDTVARRTVKPLGVATAFGMWIVLIMGATVTNTGSQTGCGPSWPLCRGRFIPQFAVSTFIEFSHRAAVGIETVLILTFAAAAWWLYRGRSDIRMLVPIMVVFLFLQAALGAWAVMAPQEPAVLALHFGISLIAFASVVLVASLVLEFGKLDSIRNRLVSPQFSSYVWAVTAFSYVVVYLGAYVRHAKADDACRGWPLCNGAAVPAFHGLVGAAFAHRLGALALTVVIVGLVAAAARVRHDRPDLFYAALAALGLVILQAASGAIVVATDVDLFGALAHAGLVALLFGTLTYLCLHVTPLPSPRGITRAVRPEREPAT